MTSTNNMHIFVRYYILLGIGLSLNYCENSVDFLYLATILGALKILS